MEKRWGWWNTRRRLGIVSTCHDHVNMGHTQHLLNTYYVHMTFGVLQAFYQPYCHCEGKIFLSLTFQLRQWRPRHLLLERDKNKINIVSEW